MYLYIRVCVCGVKYVAIIRCFGLDALTFILFSTGLQYNETFKRANNLGLNNFLTGLFPV